MQARILICGAGGHAIVLLEALRAGACDVVAAIDRDPARQGDMLDDVPIIGGDEMFDDLQQHGVTHFVIGVGSIGDASVRRRLFMRARAAGLRPFTLVHPAAIVAPSARLAPGVTVLAGAIVGTAVDIAENALINSGAIVEHHCTIGAHTHVASGACLAGGVRVDSDSHVGLGAVVRETCSIGTRVVVGAGAVVCDDVPDGATVVGVPARIVRRLTDLACGVAS